MALSTNASASNYYVATWGNNNNTGMLNSPWQNVSYAVQQAYAGDTIFLIDGIWYNEHMIFTNSGNASHPINLKKFNGTVIFDGVDGTGVGIFILGKSFINISDIQIKNYNIGIDSLNSLTNLTIKDFSISDMTRGGIIFEGSSGSAVSNIKIFNFTMWNIGNGIRWDGSGIKHEFSFSNSRDFEIYNFTIRDLRTEGISFRNINNLYIHDGNIFNITTGTADAINFGNSVNNSMVENIYINGTTWHGIGLQENCAPENVSCRLYNNVLKNLTIYYAVHNAIDLHTGAINTTIENVTLLGDPFLTGNNGIQFQHNGSGLIIRNASIYGFNKGLSLAQPEISVFDSIIKYSQQDSIQVTYPNSIITNTTIINDINTSSSILIYYGATNFLINSTRLGEGKQISIKANNSGTIRDILDSTFIVNSQKNNSITIEYTDNKMYTFSGGRNAKVSKSWTPKKSYILFDTLFNDSYITVTTYPMTARPASSTATVTVTSFNTSLPSGSILADFTANTTNGNNVNFTMSTLKPYYYYLIKKDGVNLSIQQADATGKIAFNNSVWNSPSKFTVMESATGSPDGNFTIGDLVIVKEHFGEKTSSPYPKYDPNKDGVVDIMDIVYVATKIMT